MGFCVLILNETNKYSRKRNYSNKIEAVSNEAKEKPVK